MPEPNPEVRPALRAHWQRTLLVIVALNLAASTDPLADLKTGATSLDSKRYASAIAVLEPLPRRLPKLADYAAWFLANAQFDSQSYAAVPKTLAIVWQQTPPSPLAARSVLLPRKPTAKTATPRKPSIFSGNTTRHCRSLKAIW